MKNRKVLYIAITIILVVVMFFVIYNYKINDKYKKMEKNLVNSAEKYMGLYPGLLPKDENDLILTSNALKRKGYDTKLSQNCYGYVIIKKKSSFYKYEPYIKCDSYKTKGYKTN